MIELIEDDDDVVHPKDEKKQVEKTFSNHEPLDDSFKIDRLSNDNFEESILKPLER